MRWLVGTALVIALCLPGVTLAVQVGALETRWDWELAELRFSGNRDISASDLREVMITKPRAWYAPWRALPSFDPSTFETDVERLVLLYHSRGYYRVRLGYDLELPADGAELVAAVYIDEDEPVHVTSVVVDGPAPEPADTLRALLPLEPGDVFTQADYRTGESTLRSHLREAGYAHTTVARRADVDVDADRVVVTYHVDAGTPCVFGDVTIAGTKRVEPDVIRRELAFAPGAPFKESLLEQTRAKLAGLNLFQTIRFEEGAGDGAAVPIKIVVSEAPPRDVRFGIGYDTEEQVRGLASWRHYDFLGGARQLGVAARISFLRYTLLADFLQPHFPTDASRLRVIALAQREEEDGYTLDRARIMLREEWEPRPSLTTYVFYRLEYDSLSNVPTALANAIPLAVLKNAGLSSIGVGSEWSRVDDPVDPSRGVSLKSSVEPVGGVLGGDVGFLRFDSEAHAWIPLPLDNVVALRARFGTAQPWAGTAEIPLYERFYAGGTGSVRGFDRRRVGPLADGDPLGGRSVAEGSVEFRHRFTTAIAGVAFLDAGQLDQRSWRVPLDDLSLGTGIGVRYRSPVGPIQADIGFPINPQRGDNFFQLHIGIGGTF